MTSGYIPATITVSTYKFVSGTYNAVSSSSLDDALTKNGSRYTSNATAARTAATTFEVSSIDDDYAFLGWYTAASGGSLLSSDETYTAYLPTQSATIYARFSHENNHTVTISRYCTSTSSEINNTSAKVGEITYSEISAPVIAGYSFSSWSYGNGISVKAGDNTSSNPIHVKTLSSGTYTLTANYTEVLTTAWEIVGANPPFSGWAYGSGVSMSKKHGYSTEDKAYATLNVTSGANTAYEFKTAKGSNASTDFYGYGTGGTAHIQYNRSNTGTAMSVYNGTQHAGDFTPDGLGEYEFKMDYSGDPYKITVTFPANVDVVTFGKGTGGSSVTAKYGNVSFDSGTKVQRGKTVRFTQSASTGYTFRDWYTTSTGTGGTQLSTSATYDHTVGATNNVYAIYTINNHDISYTDPSHGSYTIKVGDAAAVSTNTTSDYNKTITLAATANDGYHFAGWTVTKAGGGSVTVSSNQFSMPDDDVIVAASFVANDYTVTFNKNGGSGDAMSNESFTYGTSKTLTANTYTRTGYTFQGWATSSGGSKEYDDGDDGHLMVTAHNATVELFAVWQAKTYTVNLDYVETGKGTNGEKTSVTATYDADMPAMGTAPVGATGYLFRGYFTEHNSGGTKYYDADGSSAKAWDIDEDTTLFAYFEKVEIATLPLSATMVHPWVSGETMDSITVTPTLSLDPEGTVLICYEIQYSDGSSVLDDGLQSYRVISGNTIRFRAPQNPGSYRVHAELKTNNCSGSILDTENTEFAVTGYNKVVVKYICDGTEIRSSTISSINALDSVSITAPSIDRYTFSGWSATDGVTSNTGSGVNPKKFVAIYEGTITATYVETPIVYFYNNLGWTDVWVTYDSYWDGSTKDASDADRADGDGIGSGNYGKTYHHMTNIDGTDIWYDEVPEYYTNNGFEHWAWNITFNSEQLGEEGYPSTCRHFWKGEAVIRYDFDPQNTMFVPTTGAATFVTNGTTYKSSTSTYHNDEKMQIHNCGYWKKYNSTYSGYSLRGTFGGIVGDESDWYGGSHNLVAESADANEFKTSLKLYGNRDYYFRIFRNNKYLKLDKASGFTQKDLVINQSSNRVDNAFRTDVTWVNSADVKLHSSTEGEYTFYVNFKNDGTMLVTVDFPDNAGDYQVMYKDDVHTAWHPAGIVDADATENTTSFFVRKHKHPVVKWRKSTAVANDGTITWDALQNVDLSSYQSSGQVLAYTATDTTGVYNFNFNIADGSMSLADVEEYSGQYYIRTNCASEWKWEHYTEADHRMTYSDYADAHSGYSHYFMKYAGAGTNVKFTVANDYSPCISDTLGQGTQSNYVDGSHNLIASANIRFMWNMHDNSLDRAYVGMVDRTHIPRQATRFIVLQGQDGYISDEDENELDETNQGTMFVGDDAIEFDDDENWIYETTVKAKADGRIKIYSRVNGNDYYLIGDAPLSGEGAWETTNSDYLITGTGTEWQKIRVIYDFKTNRLMAGWLPEGTIDKDMTLKADIMIRRTHQGNADQFNIAEGKTITMNAATHKTVYGVMRFNKYVLNNLVDGTSTPLPVGSQKSTYERFNYYISFPFDVNVSDIFGFGSYGPDFTLRYYDGKARAEKGYWKDSPSFWKWVAPNGTLKANEGYLLSLNTTKFGTSASVWNNSVENIELYFPASTTVNVAHVSSFDIDALDPAEYECIINRGTGTDGDRRVKDSYWRCIGVPSFAAQEDLAYNGTGNAITWQTSGTELPFLYQINWNTNGLTAVSSTTFTFQPMHAYIVQNGNKLTWTNVSKPVAAIVARERGDYERKEVTFRLELSQNDEMKDQTFVRLTNHMDVTTGFDFNQDLSKEFNEDANIYTMIGYEYAAANSLPMTEQTTVVPVGVVAETDGDYTFAMPDGTEGIGVTLIDTETGIRTSLSALDYTINLSAGTYNERFYLEISPIQQMPTGVELLNGENGANGVRKVLIDGLLYIVKDGKMFDAQGRQVK